MRPEACLVLALYGLVALAGASAPEDNAETAVAPRLASSVYPGRLAARALAREGTRRLAAGDLESATRMLEQAVAEDPLLAGAWTNLSAAYIDLCLMPEARSAATIARLLDPSSEQAATNLRISIRLGCERPDEPFSSAVTPEEIAAWTGPVDAGRFVAAAAARRARGERLVAVMLEERALELGAPVEQGLHRIALDLEAEGLWAAASRVLREAGDEQEAERLARQEETLRPVARRLALALGAEAGYAREQEFAALFRMAEVLLARGATEDAAASRLRELLEIGRPRRFEGPWGALEASSRWVRIERQAGDERAAPLLVLRRFPGDSQLVIHGAGGAAWPSDEDQVAEEVARRLAHREAVPLDRPRPCESAPEGLTCRRMDLEVVAGAEGSARVEAFVLSRAEDQAPPWRIAVLALAGDAGCGEPCLEQVRAELRQTISSIEAGSPPPPAEPAWDLPIPSAWRAPRLHDERKQPWISHRLDGLRIDLPPGFVVARQRSGFRDPRTPPAAELWLRGRFRDLDGASVVVGDASWAGWVERLRGAGSSLSSWRRDPARVVPESDPAARLTGSADLDPVLERARTGSSGLAAVFAGGEFSGRWLVHVLRVGEDAVKIVLPVVEGAASPSLSWIALTVRPEGQAPLPPPVDLSDARAIDFRRIESPSPADPRAGVLMAEHLELAVPRDFRVAISSETMGGFPVTLRRRDGSTIRIERLPPSPSGTPDARRRQSSLALGISEQAWRLHRRRRGVSVLAADALDPARRVLLVVPSEPATRPAYRVIVEIAPAAGDGPFIAELVARSLRYRR